MTDNKDRFDKYIKAAASALKNQVLKVAEEVTKGLPPKQREEMIKKLTEVGPIYVWGLDERPSRAKRKSRF